MKPIQGLRQIIMSTVKSSKLRGRSWDSLWVVVLSITTRREVEWVSSKYVERYVSTCHSISETSLKHYKRAQNFRNTCSRFFFHIFQKMDARKWLCLWELVSGWVLKVERARDRAYRDKGSVDLWRERESFEDRYIDIRTTRNIFTRKQKPVPNQSVVNRLHALKQRYINIRPMLFDSRYNLCFFLV